MNIGRTVFSQMMDCIPKRQFQKIVQHYHGDCRVREFSCLDQFLCLAFAQLTARESLRDIEACLSAQPEKLYHLGIRGRVRRSTLADANEKRDWRIFSELAHVLIQTARQLYTNDALIDELKEVAYAFDSTTISLCLKLFPWAKFRRRKGGIKLHTLINLRGNIPSFIWISPARMHDVLALDTLSFEPGAYYIFDRAYFDFTRLYRIHQSGAFYIVRDKKNICFQVIESRPVDPLDYGSGLRCDQTIRFTSAKGAREYPELLRRIKYYVADSNQTYTIFTNKFLVPALAISQFYHARWQIELFFKWIKQHLRIKVFLGTSFNAVSTQIWIAMSVYVIVAIIKKRFMLTHDPYRIMRILSLHLFEQVDIQQLLTETVSEKSESEFCNQLSLFD